MNNETKFSADRLIEDLDLHWGWLLAFGIALTVLGIISFSAVVTTTLLSVIFLGAVLLANGIILIVYALISAFRSKQHVRGRKFALNLILGIAYAFLGVLFMMRPLHGALSLTLVFAGFLIGFGVLRIISALASQRQKGWGWVLSAGILNVILGLLIGMSWPTSGLWAIGLLVGIDILYVGLTFIMMSFLARKPFLSASPV